MQQDHQRVPGWAWLVIPVLAGIAWAPVLTLWFVSDDFTLLRANTLQPWPQPFLGFGRGHAFYRPLSTTLTWNLGSALFGTNALPYHALSLGLHALTAWLLARTVAAISGQGRLGWVAGLIFAVWPLSTEPVAWLAAQWDLWAAVYGLAALWAYAAYCRSGRRHIYGLGLAAYGAALLMKETVLLLPLLLPVVAWLVAAQRDPSPTVSPAGQPRRRAAAQWLGSLLPFGLLTLLFAVLRISQAGKIGGYRGAATDFQNFFWDKGLRAMGQILDPLNRSAFPLPLVQMAGALAVGGLGVGLVLRGARRGPTLTLAAAWTGVFLLPVLNLVPSPNPESGGSRLLYWSLMGVCIAVAALLIGCDGALPRRSWRAVLLAGLLLPAVPACWGQLRPWQQASGQVQALVATLRAVLVPTVGPVQINVQGLPDAYHGSYLFFESNGAVDALALFAQQPAQVARRAALDPAALQAPLGAQAGVYNLSIGFDPAGELYQVRAWDGLTTVVPLPDGLRWDFRGCAPATLASWRPVQLQVGCTRGSDSAPAGVASLTAAGAAARWWSPVLQTDLRGLRGLRLAVCLRAGAAPVGPGARWLWLGTAAGGSDRPLLLDRSGAWRVYWTYLPADQVGTQLRGVGFVPDPAVRGLQVAWIVVTPIH